MQFVFEDIRHGSKHWAGEAVAVDVVVVAPPPEPASSTTLPWWSPPPRGGGRKTQPTETMA